MLTSCCETEKLIGVELSKGHPSLSLEAKGNAKAKKKTKITKRPDEKEERKCRQLFEDMNSKKTQKRIESEWKPLYDQYMKNPFDYTGFKREYANYTAGDEEKLKKLALKEKEDRKHVSEQQWLRLKAEDLSKKKTAADRNLERLEKEAKLKIPVMFESMHYLHAEVFVNGTSAHALIDTGAMSTAISSNFARKAGLENMIDTRHEYRGIHSGVGGSTKAVGSIHSCTLKLGDVTVEAPFDVLVSITGSEDVLIGMPILRALGCNIDTASNRIAEKLNLNFYSAEQLAKQMSKRLTKNKSFKIDKKICCDLVEMGFDKKKAENALKDSANNIVDAACFLHKDSQMSRSDFTDDESAVESISSIHSSTTLLSTEVITDADVHTHEAKQISVSAEGKEESDCKKLFEDMQKPMVKWTAYCRWRPLHDQFIKNTCDYDNFRREYAKMRAAGKETLGLMDDSSSAIGRLLMQKKERVEFCDQQLKQRAEKGKDKIKREAYRTHIRMSINGITTVALVDTGASLTVVSQSFAENAKLIDKTDKRDRTKVVGIGGLDITLGTIYLCEIQIGCSQFHSKVKVMKTYNDVIIGLDFLRQHKCRIDLTANRLILNESTEEEFLTKEELRVWKSGRKIRSHHSFKVDTNKLEQLVSMGFDKEDGGKALTHYGNDLDWAVYDFYYYAQKKMDKKVAAAVEVSQGVSEEDESAAEFLEDSQ